MALLDRVDVLCYGSNFAANLTAYLEAFLPVRFTFYLMDPAMIKYSHPAPPIEVLENMFSKEFVAYWTHLGYLIAAFSTMESTIQRVLRHYAKVDAKTARALFSGIRIHDACSLIIRIAEAKNRKVLKAQLEKICHHLTDLNKARNEIVHYGAYFEGDDKSRLFVNNSRLALTAERVTNRPVSVDDLWSMAADLGEISVRFHLLMHYARTPEGKATTAKRLAQEWLYKPPQLKSTRPLNQNKRGSQKRRQKVSQKSPRSHQNP